MDIYLNSAQFTLTLYWPSLLAVAMYFLIGFPVYLAFMVSNYYIGHKIQGRVRTIFVFSVLYALWPVFLFTIKTRRRQLERALKRRRKSA